MGSLSSPWQPQTNGTLIYEGPGYYSLTNVQANGGNPVGTYYVSNEQFMTAYNTDVLSQTSTSTTTGDVTISYPANLYPGVGSVTYFVTNPSWYSLMQNALASGNGWGWIVSASYGIAPGNNANGQTSEAQINNNIANGLFNPNYPAAYAGVITSYTAPPSNVTEADPAISVTGGSPIIGNTVNINVAGLTPNGTWILYDENGNQLTQSHSLSATGTGSLVYDITSNSPLAGVINAGGWIYARDSSGISTPKISV
jgi:hypothetical protein